MAKTLTLFAFFAFFALFASPVSTIQSLIEKSHLTSAIGPQGSVHLWDSDFPKAGERFLIDSPVSLNKPAHFNT